MEITSSKEQKQVNTFLIIICLFVAVLLADETQSIFCAVVCYIPLGYISLANWISTGKKIILTKEGCQIYFFTYRKFYKWDEIKTIEYTNFKNTYKPRSPYEEGVYFSKKNLKKPKKIELTMYAILVHPFSLIYVNFKNGEPYMSCAVYEVEKDIFLNTMQEWGIAINGLI